MNMDSDDLLARIRADFPVEFELAQLRLLVTMLQQDNDQLRAAQGTYDPGSPRPFLDATEPRHG